MTRVKLEINVPGFNEVRNSPEIRDELLDRAMRAADAAGGAPDFEVIESHTKTRARVIVVTATREGRRAEATDRALTRGFDAARG